MEKIIIPGLHSVSKTAYKKEIKQPGFCSVKINPYGFPVTFKFPFETLMVRGHRVEGKRDGIWYKYLDGLIFQVSRYDKGKLTGKKQINFKTHLNPMIFEEYVGKETGQDTSELDRYYEFRDEFRIFLKNNKSLSLLGFHFIFTTLNEDYDFLTSSNLKKHPQTFWKKVRSIHENVNYPLVQTKKILLNEEPDGDDECNGSSKNMLILARKLIEISAGQELSKYQSRKLINRALFELEVASMLIEDEIDWLNLFSITDTIPHEKICKQKLVKFWAYFSEISEDFKHFQDLPSLLKEIRLPDFKMYTVPLAHWEREFKVGKWDSFNSYEILILSEELGFKAKTKEIEISDPKFFSLGELIHNLNKDRGELFSQCMDLLQKKYNEGSEDLFSLYRLSLMFSDHLPQGFPEKVFKSLLMKQNLNKRIDMSYLFPLIKYPSFLLSASKYQKYFVKKLRFITLSKFELVMLFTCTELKFLRKLFRDYLSLNISGTDVGSVLTILNDLRSLSSAGTATYKGRSISRTLNRISKVFIDTIYKSLYFQAENMKAEELEEFLDALGFDYRGSDGPIQEIYSIVITRIFNVVTKIDPNKRFDGRKISREEKIFTDLALRFWGDQHHGDISGLKASLSNEQYTELYILCSKHPRSMRYLPPSYDLKLDIGVLWNQLMQGYDEKVAGWFEENFRRVENRWIKLIVFLGDLKASLQEPEIQIKVLSEEPSYVTFFRNHIDLFVRAARMYPPEGLNEILVKEQILDVLDSVGVSLEGVDRKKSLSKMVDVDSGNPF